MPRLNEETGLKECSKCHEHKPAGEFHKDKSRKDGLADRCKICLIIHAQSKNNEPSEIISSYKCYSCKIEKNISEFPLNKRKKFGYDYRCKECNANYKNSLNYEIDYSITNKQCTKCNLLLNIVCFGKTKRNKDGLSNVCKDCTNANSRINAKSEHRRLKNRTTARELYQTNEIYALHSRFVSNIRNWLSRNSMTKNFKSVDIIGCSFEFFKEHIEGQFVDSMTWDNRSDWHLDHFIPIKIADSLENVKMLNHYTNIRPLYGIDNLLKNDKIPSMDEVLEFFKNHKDSPALKLYLERFDTNELLVQNK